MTSPNPEQQKAALQELSNLFDEPSTVLCDSLCKRRL